MTPLPSSPERPFRDADGKAVVGPPMGVALPDLTLAGTKIKALRRQQGLSANALSRLSGVARATILNIESGRSITPRADVLLGLARVLGVTVEWLASDESPNGHSHETQ